MLTSPFLLPSFNPLAFYTIVDIYEADLLPSSSLLPSPLPSKLALTPLNSRLSLSFLSVPSIPDHSTLAVYALPTSTAETVVEEVCERMGLIRRMTIGGETKGKGREKWGGGERVEYGLEEVWEPKAKSGKKEGESKSLLTFRYHINWVRELRAHPTSTSLRRSLVQSRIPSLPSPSSPPSSSNHFTFLPRSTTPKHRPTASASLNPGSSNLLLLPQPSPQPQPHATTTRERKKRRKPQRLSKPPTLPLPMPPFPSKLLALHQHPLRRLEHLQQHLNQQPHDSPSSTPSTRLSPPLPLLRRRPPQRQLHLLQLGKLSKTITTTATASWSKQSRNRCLLRTGWGDQGWVWVSREGWDDQRRTSELEKLQQAQRRKLRLKRKNLKL